MKSKILFALSAILASGAAHNAFAAAPYAYGNAITTNNIISMQHALVTNAIQSFDNATTWGVRAHAPRPGVKNPRDLYGHLPLYGTMLQYGEYNDDGSAMLGHNGGDVNEPAIFNPENMWLNWQHFDEQARFHHYADMDTDSDLIMAGLPGGHNIAFGDGFVNWGLFGGYIGSTQDNHDIELDEKGGTIGLFSNYNIDEFDIAMVINGGILHNKATGIIDHNTYNNRWAGVSLNTTYNIIVNDTFLLQPGIFTGYTWIQSANYTISPNTSIANKNINAFTVAPSLRLVQGLGASWFAIANARCVFAFPHGGDMWANNMPQQKIKANDYVEYGIGIEKNIDRFNMAINVGRHDGGRRGWTWGTSMKYVF